MRAQVGTGVKVSRVEPACPKAAPLGRRETTTANLTSTLTTSATKIQQRNPYMPTIHLSALLLCSILPSIAIGSTFVFASPMCSLAFQFLPVLSSMPWFQPTVVWKVGCSKNLRDHNLTPACSAHSNTRAFHS